MPRLSIVARLPVETRAAIAAARDRGLTIEEISSELARLGAPTISRSALGRHIKSLDALRGRRAELEPIERLVGELRSVAKGRERELAAARLTLILADGPLSPRELDLAALIVLLTTAGAGDGS